MDLFSCYASFSTVDLEFGIGIHRPTKTHQAELSLLLGPLSVCFLFGPTPVVNNYHVDHAVFNRFQHLIK